MEENWESVVSTAELNEVERDVVLMDKAPLIPVGELQASSAWSPRQSPFGYGLVEFCTASSHICLAAIGGLGMDKNVKWRCRGFICSILREWNSMGVDEGRKSRIEGLEKEVLDLESHLGQPDVDRPCGRHLDSIGAQVSPKGAKRHDTALSLEDLIGTVNYLCRGRSLGLDGLTMEFFRAFWDILDLEGWGGWWWRGGFRMHFVAWFQLLYTAVECLVKINESLMEPLRFGRGQMGPLLDELLCFTYSTWESIFALLKNPGRRIGMSWKPNPILLIYRHLVSQGVDKSISLLVALLLGLAKMAINRSRQQAKQQLVVPDCLPLFRGYVCARVSWRGTTWCSLA
eukprot:g38659.t1